MRWNAPTDDTCFGGMTNQEHALCWNIRCIGKALKPHMFRRWCLEIGSGPVCNIHRTGPCPIMPTSFLKLAVKMVSWHASLGALQEQIGHVWGFLMCLTGDCVQQRVIAHCLVISECLKLSRLLHNKYSTVQYCSNCRSPPYPFARSLLQLGTSVHK